jgi:2-polyprenyl-3-methyl-5-hydroxy-6-metoxy-1,4-benzoquinol methylase
MDYALYFTSPYRKITGIDYDEEKIQVANNCFSKDENINFIATDAVGFSFDNYDAIIMSDVLHYLDANAQQKLIEKCLQQLEPGWYSFYTRCECGFKAASFLYKDDRIFFNKTYRL